MTRILQLIPSLLPGGAERQLAYLCGGLCMLGNDVHVGILADGPLRARAEVGGAQIHLLRRASGSIDLKPARALERVGHGMPSIGNYDPTLLLRIYTLLRRVRADLVQTWIPLMDITGGVAARLSGVPWMLTERTAPLALPTMRKLQLRGWLARRAAGVVSNSQGGDDYWQSVLGDRVPRAIIHNALPIDELEVAEPPPLRSFGLREDAPLVVYLGRIVPGKSVDLVVKTLARVLAQTDAVGLLCGFGSLEDSARRWIAEAGLTGRVAVSGFVPQGYSLLKRAAVFLTLSEIEGMPNTVMEAMALRCPIVASDIPAHREILDESNAAIVPIDAQAAAAAVLAVLRDPAAASARAARARVRAETWSVAAVADRYADFYERIAGGSPRAR